MKESLNIMVSANSAFFRYLVVMLTSVYENNQDVSVSVYLLYSNLSPEEISVLRQEAERYDARLTAVKIDEKQFQRYPVMSIWSIETYFRLMAIELLPENMERILYLDVDVIVDGSLWELYQTDFDDKYFVVCEDNQGFIKAADQNRKWGRDLRLKYFNAGVLLYNLNKLRREFNFQRFDVYAKQLNYCLTYVDQDLLNYIFGEAVKYEDEKKYNKMIRYAEQGAEAYKQYGTVIYHYAADNKPWGAKYLSPFFRIWWDYAARTPFYGELKDSFFDNYYKEAQKDIKSSGIFRQYYQLCVQWLKENGNPCFLKEYFFNRQWHRIGIYGMGELGGILYRQLIDSGIQVSYAVDRDPGLINREELSVPLYAATDELPETDVIVITPVVYAEEIKEDLMKKGSFSIVSLEDVMFRQEEAGGKG